MKEENRTPREKRILGVISLVILFVFTGVVCWFVGRPMIRFVSEPEVFRQWIADHGMYGRVVFVGMVVLQVLVAIIPGEPFEIGAGYAFGAVEGTVLCLIGILLGSALVFTLVRRFGLRLVEAFFDPQKIRSLKFLQDSKKRDVFLFLIFLIPGTPKDLLSYFAGLTQVKCSTWLFIACVARLPSLVSSTVGGNALGVQNYLVAAVVFAVTLLISGCGYLVYRGICRRHARKRQKE